MKYIRIENWHTFQHYKDRRPTWIKLLIEIIEEFDADGNPKKYYPMPDNAKTTFLHLLCLRANYNDKIPYPDDKWLRKRLGLRRITLQPLVDAGFIVIDTESVSEPYQDDTESAHQRESKRESNIKESKRKSKSKKFIPPTLPEVIEYVREKGYQVDVKKFFEYYSESDWHDRDGKPVRSWKQKIIAVWNKPGGPKKCRSVNCKELGVYTSTDDTGQVCWWCEAHKQGWKPALPKELTENTLKIVKSDKRSLSDKQNEQKDKLGVR